MKINDKFIWLEDDIKISDCAICKHKYPNNASCDAYPKGIPQDIISGKVKHRKPYAGDDGIRFEELE
jgi:hypothetical protein